MRNKRKRKGNSGIGPWQALRDMVIAAMNRGQLPILSVFLLILVVLLRMPEDDLSKLAFSVLEKLEKGELWAYGVLCVVILCWYVHARLMRKEFSIEMERVGKEKSKLQSKLTNTKLKSSNKR